MPLTVRTIPGLLAVFLVFTGCGFNPKDSGGGFPLGMEKGTVECLYAGCHDSVTGTTASYPGFKPAVSWALGFHGKVGAPAASMTDTCTDCHDPIDDAPDYALLFTSGSGGVLADSVHSALGLTPKPVIGCEGCHGSGMSHYAYTGTTPYYGDHRQPMDSTVTAVFPNPYHLLSCGPCHSPSHHAGGASLDNILANQYGEWFGGDGRGFLYDDGHADSLVPETLQGFMTGEVRGTPCTACHTVEGFVTYFALADPSWASSQGFIDRLVEETSDTLIDDNRRLPGQASLAQVSCVSCHPSHDGDNLLRLNILDYGGAAGDTTRRALLCVTCHNVRGLPAAEGAGQAGTGGLEIPRHPQKEIFQGSTENDGYRGVEIAPYFVAGDSLHAGTPNLPGGCTDCHYITVTDVDRNDLPQKATTGHSFRPRLETCLTGSPCHDGTDFLLKGGEAFSYVDTTIAAFDFGSIYYSGTAHGGTDYDQDGTVEPFQAEISGMLADLKTSLTDAGVPFDLTSGLFDLTQMASRTTTERAAAYNYDYVVGDGSRGMHNPIYVVNLLAASISAVEAP